MNPLDWFPDTPATDYIVGILAVLIVILALLIAYASIELSFIITSEILRATFLVTAIIIYSHITFFISVPIGLIFQDKVFADQMENYGKNIKKMAHKFYSTEKKEKERLPPTYYTTVAAHSRYVQRKTVRHERRTHRHAHRRPIVYKADPHFLRDEELTAKTQIISRPNSRFFCSKCGKPFTSAMIKVLNSKQNTFCESCGTKFIIENEKPVPLP